MPNISRFAIGSAKALGLNSNSTATNFLLNWVTYFEGSGFTSIVPSHVAVAGNEYYVAGYADPSLATGTYPWLLKINDTGNVDPSFSATFPPTTNPQNFNIALRGLEVDEANDLLYMLLNVTLISTGAITIVLVKYNLATNTIALSKQSSLGSGVSITSKRIKLSSDGSSIYVLTGNGTNSFVTKLVTSTFVHTWTRFMSGVSSLDGIAVDASDNVYAAGSQLVTSIASGLLVSWDSSGTLRWKKIDEPASSIYSYLFNDVVLSTDKSNVFGVGTKNDIFGQGSIEIMHSPSTGNYNFSFSSINSWDGDGNPTYYAVPFSTNTTSKVFVNDIGSPDGVNYSAPSFSYKLSFVASTQFTTLSPSESSVGINTTSNKFVTPFDTTANTGAYFSSLPLTTDAPNGTYGIFTIGNTSISTMSAEFTTQDSTLTSTTTTVSFTTDFNFTPGTITPINAVVYSLLFA